MKNKIAGGKAAQQSQKQSSIIDNQLNSSSQYKGLWAI